MINMNNTLFEFESDKNNVEYLLRQMCDLINFDIGLILKFDNNNKVARVISAYIRNNVDTIDKVLIKKVLSDHEVNEKINLEASKNKFLIIDYTLFDKGNPTEYVPLLKFAKKEIYIPITLEDDLFLSPLCYVYLCSYNEKIEIDTDKLDFSVVSEKIAEISAHMISINSRENWFLFLFNICHFFSELISIKDESILSHSFNVAYFSVMLAEKFQLTIEEKEKLFYASILHDIGKIYIDDSILKKEGKFNEDELSKMKKHSLLGYSLTRGIFCNINKLSDIPTIIKHHHERVDGTGYPDKLKGDEIPFYSKLICVSDSIDAMLSKRTYKENKGINYVVRELIKNKDKQFDGEIVKAALDVLNNPMRFNQFNFFDRIMWCAIVLHLKSEFKIIQESVTRENGFYQFRYFSKKDIDITDIKEVRKVELFIPVNMNVLEYETDVICLTEDYAYFSSIKEKINSDSFSVLWDLTGTFNGTQNTFIANIYKIGGSSLNFCVQDMRIENYLKGRLSTLKILFDDKSSVEVTGIINNILKIGTNIYCQFGYSNLSEGTRDKIFAQIFKRQRQLKKV